MSQLIANRPGHFFCRCSFGVCIFFYFVFWYFQRLELTRLPKYSINWNNSFPGTYIVKEFSCKVHTSNFAKITLCESSLNSKLITKTTIIILDESYSNYCNPSLNKIIWSGGQPSSYPGEIFNLLMNLILNSGTSLARNDAYHCSKKVQTFATCTIFILLYIEMTKIKKKLNPGVSSIK